MRVRESSPKCPSSSTVTLEYVAMCSSFECLCEHSINNRRRRMSNVVVVVAGRRLPPHGRELNAMYNGDVTARAHSLAAVARRRPCGPPPNPTPAHPEPASPASRVRQQFRPTQLHGKSAWQCRDTQRWRRWVQIMLSLSRHAHMSVCVCFTCSRFVYCGCGCCALAFGGER